MMSVLRAVAQRGVDGIDYLPRLGRLARAPAAAAIPLLLT